MVTCTPSSIGLSAVGCRASAARPPWSTTATKRACASTTFATGDSRPPASSSAERRSPARSRLASRSRRGAPRGAVRGLFDHLLHHRIRRLAADPYEAATLEEALRPDPRFLVMQTVRRDACVPAWIGFDGPRPWPGPVAHVPRARGHEGPRDAVA